MVGPNSADGDYQLKDTRISRNDDGTVALTFQATDYFRSDNPNVFSSLPIVAQMEAQGGYIYDSLDSITVT